MEKEGVDGNGGSCRHYASHATQIGTFLVIHARGVQEEGLDGLLQSRVTEEVTEEVVERHLEEELEIATHVLDEVRLLPSNYAYTRNALLKEVLGKQGTKEKTVICVEGDDSVTEQQWIDGIIECDHGWLLRRLFLGRGW